MCLGFPAAAIQAAKPSRVSYHVCLPILLLFLWTFVAHAGRPRQDSTSSSKSGEPTIRTNVREVLVPVVVTDKKGRHVSDLKASDFTVTEDGTPQKIVAFKTANGSSSALPTDSATGKSDPAPDLGSTDQGGMPSRHVYWILLDTLHSSVSNFNRVRDALSRFFQQESATDTQYSVIAIGREASLIQAPTGDTAAMVNAIQDKKITKAILDTEASNTAYDASRFSEAVRQYCDVCSGACLNWPAKRNPEQCTMRTNQVESMLTQFGERSLVLNKEFLRLLTEEVRALAKLPASRTVILISDGFNRFPGQEFYAILQGFGAKDRQFVFNPQDTQSDLDAILKEAVSSNTRFYTLDSRGVYALAEVAGSGADASTGGLTGGLAPQAAQGQVSLVAHANTDALAELANETGGVFFENSNDLLKGIRRAFADGREYYVLAYVPTNTMSDGKFRKISVNVTKKNLFINAKAGYWATGH